jgi:hypothetical protein
MKADHREREDVERITRDTTFKQLQELHDDELVRRYEVLLSTSRPQLPLGPEDYLNELTRRTTEKQGQRLEWLTSALFALTLVIAVATLVLVLVTILG